MRDNDHAVDAEERRATVLGVIHALPESLKGGRREPGTKTSSRTAVQLFAQHRLDRLDEPFPDFQGDVAREPVADDNVRASGKQLLRLQVADERQRRSRERSVGVTRQLVALASLFSD